WLANLTCSILGQDIYFVYVKPFYGTAGLPNLLRVGCFSHAFDRFDCKIGAERHFHHSFGMYFAARRKKYTDLWKKCLQFAEKDGRIETRTNKEQRRCFRNAQHQVCKEAREGERYQGDEQPDGQERTQDHAEEVRYGRCCRR